MTTPYYSDALVSRTTPAELLASVAEAVEGTSDGPWRVDDWDNELHVASDAFGAPHIAITVGDDAGHADARFIAASRSLLPAVAEALGRLLGICNGLSVQQTICELSHFRNDDEAEAAFDLLYKNWADLRAFLAGTEGT